MEKNDIPAHSTTILEVNELLKNGPPIFDGYSTPYVFTPEHGAKIFNQLKLHNKGLRLEEPVKNTIYIYSREHMSLLNCTLMFISNRFVLLNHPKFYSLTTMHMGDIDFLYVKDGRLVATTVKDSYPKEEKPIHRSFLEQIGVSW